MSELDFWDIVFAAQVFRGNTVADATSYANKALAARQEEWGYDNEDCDRAKGFV